MLKKLYLLFPKIPFFFLHLFFHIQEQEIMLEFIRAPGPGGQNVNKVSSAVILRFDTHSPSIPEDIRMRLENKNKKRITKEGFLVIKAHRHRTQEQNRADAVQRLIELLRQAAAKPKVRKPTCIPSKSKMKRRETKRRLSQKKRLRGGVDLEEG